MNERRPPLSEELRYRMLRQLETDSSLSQRELAEKLGISLGKLNYCVRALVDKGWVKARNFKNNNNKLAYMYYLTPRGIEEKAKLAVDFLRIRMREVEALRQEIADMQRQARQRARAAGEK